MLIALWLTRLLGCALNIAFSPDALQVAACLQAGAGVFVTNDRRLARLASVMDVIVLDDCCIPLR